MRTITTKTYIISITSKSIFLLLIKFIPTSSSSSYTIIKPLCSISKLSICRLSTNTASSIFIYKVLIGFTITNSFNTTSVSINSRHISFKRPNKIYTIFTNSTIRMTTSASIFCSTIIFKTNFILISLLSIKNFIRLKTIKY